MVQWSQEAPQVRAAVDQGRARPQAIADLSGGPTSRTSCLTCEAGREAPVLSGVFEAERRPRNWVNGDCHAHKVCPNIFPQPDDSPIFRCGSPSPAAAEMRVGPRAFWLGWVGPAHLGVWSSSRTEGLLPSRPGEHRGHAGTWASTSYENLDFCESPSRQGVFCC